MVYHNLIDDERVALYNKTADLLFDGINITDACKKMGHCRGKFNKWLIYNRVDAYQFYLKIKNSNKKEAKDNMKNPLKPSKHELRKIDLKERTERHGKAGVCENVWLRIPLPPSVNGSNKLGKHGLYNSHAYETYKYLIKHYISNEKAVHGRFAVVINAQEPSKHAPDLDNIVKPLLDVLQDNGIIENDKFNREMVVKWVGVGELCDVFITKLEDVK